MLGAASVMPLTSSPTAPARCAAAWTSAFSFSTVPAQRKVGAGGERGVVSGGLGDAPRHKVGAWGLGRGRIGSVNWVVRPRIQERRCAIMVVSPKTTLGRQTTRMGA